MLEISAKSADVLLGCLQTSAGECINCANGFVRKGGRCEKGVRECVEYGKDGKCVACAHEFSLVFDECRHDFLLGCREELDDHRCKECFAPYELDNFQCVIPNCKRYNDYGCYSCQCGFFITEKHSCRKYEEGCLKYYRGVCESCLPGFKMFGGSCQIDGCEKYADGKQCAACKEEYDLVKGVCRLRNCEEWRNDVCFYCRQGFNLVGGKCVRTEEKFVCQ